MKRITITRPDDWHLHLRDGGHLRDVLPDTARRFARAIVMPNLKPPVTTVNLALEYRGRILAALPAHARFDYPCFELRPKGGLVQIKEPIHPLQVQYGASVQRDRSAKYARAPGKGCDWHLVLAGAADDFLYLGIDSFRISE